MMTVEYSGVLDTLSEVIYDESTFCSMFLH
jgi:hypothetical protein